MKIANTALFETKRLSISRLKKQDQPFFMELLTNPKIINPIPQSKMEEAEITSIFKTHLEEKRDLLKNKINVLGIYEKGQQELIGLFLFLTNDENDRELGYRFRPEFWGKGYGTELLKGILDFVFFELKLGKITADVNIENTASVKILEKYLSPVKEFNNEREGSRDRRYELKKGDWVETAKKIIFS